VKGSYFGQVDQRPRHFLGITVGYLGSVRTSRRRYHSAKQAKGFGGFMDTSVPSTYGWISGSPISSVFALSLGVNAKALVCPIHGPLQCFYSTTG
jgi:hypothetical protein